MNKLWRWYRARLFIKAYKIQRNEYERHRDAGHNIEFEAVNSAYMFTKCHNCPDLFPDRKKPGPFAHSQIPIGQVTEIVEGPKGLEVTGNLNYPAATRKHARDYLKEHDPEVLDALDDEGKEE